MRVVNYYWYKVISSSHDENQEDVRLFKTRQEVSKHLGISIHQVRYYSKRTTDNPRCGAQYIIIKLSSATKIPVACQEATQHHFVRPKVI